MIVKFNVYCLAAAATAASVATAIGLHNQKPQLQQLQQQQPPQLQQQQPLQQSQQQQTKDEKHVDSKSYLDSDITSIFSNRTFAGEKTIIIFFIEPVH